MGSYLDKPVTEKHSDSGSGNGVRWGVSCMQGWRTGMEDAHVTLAELKPEFPALSFFAVFDGHGGKQVANFCEVQVPIAFKRNLAKTQQRGDAETDAIGAALIGTFHQMDDMLRMPEYYTQAFPDKTGGAEGEGGGRASQKPRVIQMMEEKLKERVESDMAQAKQAGRIAKEDAEKLGVRMNMLKKLSSFSVEGAQAPDPAGPAASCGCTAVTVVLTQTQIVCGNAGDSRAVLCRAGAARPLSEDHKPNKPSELRRIEAAGGHVEAQQAANGGRVQHRVRPGGLSLSRAIGDLQGKARPDLRPEEQVICSTPEICVEPREPSADEFIVIACDGIWDVMSSSETCVFVRRRLLKGMAPPVIVEELMDACICKDPKQTQGIGGDNMTCVIVMLQSPEAMADLNKGARSKSCFPLLCGRGK